MSPSHRSHKANPKDLNTQNDISNQEKLSVVCLCKTPCRSYREQDDGTLKCRNPKARGESTTDCKYFTRRWPVGIQVPDLKKPMRETS